MSNLIVAKTILEQLGGNRFVVMTGAKNFVGSENSLSFRIGCNSSKANCVMIELTPMDTYTVTFRRAAKHKTKGFELKDISKHEDVYFDQLQSLFTRVTGLHTHL